MKTLANEIYNNLFDMDFADYDETQTEDLYNLIVKKFKIILDKWVKLC